MLLIKALLFLI